MQARGEGLPQLIGQLVLGVEAQQHSRLCAGNAAGARASHVLAAPFALHGSSFWSNAGKKAWLVLKDVRHEVLSPSVTDTRANKAAVVTRFIPATLQGCLPAHASVHDLPTSPTTHPLKPVEVVVLLEVVLVVLVLVRVLVVSLVVVLVVVLHLQLLSLELMQVQRNAGPAFHPPVQIVLFPQNSKQTETVTTSKVDGADS